MKTPNFYWTTRHFLAKHNKLSFILSHGGLHLAVLFALTVAIVLFSIRIHYMSRRDYMEATYTLEDIKDESVVTHFVFKSSPEFNKKNNLRYFWHHINAELQPKKTDISQLGLAHLAPYIPENCKKQEFTHDYFRLGRAIVNTVPDSIFYSIMHLPEGETRQQARGRLNDSLSAVRSRTTSYTRNRAGDISLLTVGENLSALKKALPLKHSVAFRDSATAKNIRLVGNIQKVFGGGIINNNASEYADSSISVTPLHNPVGLEIRGSRPHISDNSFKFQGSFWGKHENNPYYMGRLNFRIKDFRLDEQSLIVLDFSPDPDKASSVIVFDHIYPEPTETFVNRLEFRGKEAVERAISSGIYVEAHDVAEAYKNDRLYILYSVLLGTFLGFALDIIIQLIYKWRRLNND